MSVSTSRIAYDDCFAILDKALDTKNGIGYYEDTEGKANHLCSRLNYARYLARKLSTEVFEEGTPGYGVSEYDRLIIRRPKETLGKWWIYIERASDINMERVVEL